jgi:MFS family permease
VSPLRWQWRATALGGLVGGYPFGYLLCSLAALIVVPLWGWRALLLPLSFHLGRLVRLDAVLPSQRKASRLPDDGHLSLGLDVLRHNLQLWHRPRLHVRDDANPRHPVGATFAIGLGFASLAPMIMGWIPVIRKSVASPTQARGTVEIAHDHQQDSGRNGESRDHPALPE